VKVTGNIWDGLKATSQMSEIAGTTRETLPRWLRATLIVGLASALLAGGLIGPLALAFGSPDNLLVQIIFQHAAVFVGVPWAGGASFIVVLSLRSTFGDVELKAGFLDFKGASGPILFWILSFMAEIFAINMLWN
jgi:hypothetical protein